MKSKRISIIAILSLLFVFSLAISVNLFHSSKANADYEVTTLVDDTFEMIDGVSLKLNEDGGIRFKVKMGESINTYISDESVELGFIIAPKVLMGGQTDYLSMSQKLRVAVDKSKIYEEGGYYIANGCITKVKQANRQIDFSAVAYILDGDQVQYTSFNNLSRGNLYNVVNQAVLSDYTEDVFALTSYNSWYATEDYPIVIKNEASYDALIDIINESDILSGKSVKVVGEVEPTKEISNEDNKPTINQYYTITFDRVIESDVVLTVLEGETPEAPAHSVRAGYSYAWDNDIAEATETVTYTEVETANTNTAYTVKHYKQNAIGDGYTLADTDNLTGTTGTQTSAVAKVYTNFTANSFEQATINGNGTTVVEIRYDRDVYTVTTYDESGDKIADNDVRYGAQVYSAVSAPSKTGYTFLKWQELDNDTYTDIAVNATVTGDMTLKAVYLCAVGSVYNDATYNGIVSDNGVRALKTTATNNVDTNNGLKLTFAGSIDPREYQVILDMRAENSTAGSLNMYFNISNTYVSGGLSQFGLSNTYNEIDISAIAISNSISSISSFDIFVKGATAKIFVKEIKVIERAYTVTTLDESGDKIEDIEVNYYGTAIYGNITAPAKTGYTFLKWQKWDGEDYTDIANNETITGDITLKAVYLNAVGSAYGTGSTYAGIVNDNGVKALKATSVQSSSNNGLTLTFAEGIDTIKYKVLLDIRAENSSANTVTMYHKINGRDVSGGLTGLSNTYSEIDLSAFALRYNNRSLTSVDIYAKVVTNIYVKGIRVVERESGETFTIKFTNQWNTVLTGISKKNDVGTITNQNTNTAPSGAPTGVSYCLKYYDSSKTGGLVIDFGGLDVSKYASINVNFGTVQNWNIGINGAYATWGTGSTNITKDLVTICNNKSITTLNSMYIEKSGTLDTVYLYTIEFTLA